MMESQYKNNEGIDGVVESSSGERAKGGGVGVGEVVLRVLALVLTLVAAVVLGINKQTKTVPIKISADLPALYVPVTAKSSYLSAFVYFVVSNSIACAVAAVTLILALATKGGRKGIPALTIILIDLMMVALLFSGIGSAGAAGMLGMKGNSHLRWNKVCDVYGKFCHQTTAAIGVSLLGGIIYLVLVALGVSKLQKRC